MTPELLSSIASKVSELGMVSDGTIQTLKQTWPDLRFTLCNNDDMPARMNPALEGSGFNLYLVGGGEHCLSLTENFAGAIGVVVAEVTD